MTPKSPYRRRRLAPRCRLIASWGWSRSQGYGCSPFKAVRELGLERRETVRSLSAVGVRDLRGALPSTRGPGESRGPERPHTKTLPFPHTRSHYKPPEHPPLF